MTKLDPHSIYHAILIKEFGRKGAMKILKNAHFFQFGYLGNAEWYKKVKANYKKRAQRLPTKEKARKGV